MSRRPKARPSCGTSSPSSPTILASRPSSGRPCLQHKACFSSTAMAWCWRLGRLASATGLASVMPQACTTSTPSAANRSIITGGQAEPPIPTLRNGPKLCCSCRVQSRSPIQTVGTPAVMVTPSRVIRPCRLTGSSLGPGRTSLAPTITAAYGSPQALTWNIGTTGMTHSAAASPNVSGMATIMACSTHERCE